MMRNLTVNHTNERSAENEGCVRLWASVVRCATADMMRTGRHVKEPHRAQALAWFLSKSQHIGSFLWCCDMLGLSSQAVREKLANGGLKDLKAKYAGLMANYNKGRDKPLDAPKDPEV